MLENISKTDSVAVGSPLVPVIAILFMEYFENIALYMAPAKPGCFYHYVYDTFVVWPHGCEKLGEFFDHIKNIHDKINFTRR